MCPCGHCTDTQGLRWSLWRLDWHASSGQGLDWPASRSLCRDPRASLVLVYANLQTGPAQPHDAGIGIHTSTCTCSMHVRTYLYARLLTGMSSDLPIQVHIYAFVRGHSVRMSIHIAKQTHLLGQVSGSWSAWDEYMHTCLHTCLYTFMHVCLYTWLHAYHHTCLHTGLVAKVRMG